MCVLAKHQSKQPNAEAGSVCFLTKSCSYSLFFGPDRQLQSIAQHDNSTMMYRKVIRPSQSRIAESSMHRRLFIKDNKRGAYNFHRLYIPQIINAPLCIYVVKQLAIFFAASFIPSKDVSISSMINSLGYFSHVSQVATN